MYTPSAYILNFDFILSIVIPWTFRRDIYGRMAESLYISSTNVLKPAISDLSLIVIVHPSSDIVPIAVIEPSFLSDLLSLPILSKLSFTATS